MASRTLPVLTHSQFPQVFAQALNQAVDRALFPDPRTDDQRKEQNAAVLVALWNLGATLSCSLCGMKNGQPGEVHVVGHEQLCLPCAEELFG